jgi:hypothetical protein
VAPATALCVALGCGSMLRYDLLIGTSWVDAFSPGELVVVVP